MKAPAPVVEINYWRSPRLLNIGLASYTLSHHSFPRHFHDHYVIELVVQGADKFYCNGETHTASPNELVFINPGEVHTGNAVSDQPLRYYSISPDKNELQHIAAILEKPLPEHFSFQQSLSTQSALARKMMLLFNSIQACKTETMKCEELFFDLMNEMIDTACSYDAYPHTAKDPRIETLIEFLHASVSEPVSLQQMAELVRISPYHLIRLFKAATGLSPYEYLLILRIERAKRLVRQGCHVRDAAWEAGFYDASHFNRLFKKVSGVTPKIFRLSK